MFTSEIAGTKFSAATACRLRLRSRSRRGLISEVAITSASRSVSADDGSCFQSRLEAGTWGESPTNGKTERRKNKSEDADMERLGLFALSFACLLCSAECMTKCVRARGKLECSTDPRKAGGVRVLLMDRDVLPWETDDLMGSAISDASGWFEVEGCGYDVGPWNEPDPFIVIEHNCPSADDDADDSPKTKIASMWRTYLPHETNVGTIELDENK